MHYYLLLDVLFFDLQHETSLNTGQHAFHWGKREVRLKLRAGAFSGPQRERTKIQLAKS